MKAKSDLEALIVPLYLSPGNAQSWIPFGLSIAKSVSSRDHSARVIWYSAGMLHHGVRLDAFNGEMTT
jgi:hypothetical protein